MCAFRARDGIHGGLLFRRWLDCRQQVELVHEVDDVRASYDAAVQFEMDGRRVLDGYSAREHKLKIRAPSIQLREHLVRLGIRPDDRDIDET